MIGHLQRNKVRDALAHFGLIHSLDSERLAREVERQAAMRGERREALLEVNVSGEASKYGVAPDAVEALLAATESLAYLRVTGLMTMPPLTSDPEASRPLFRQLREMRDRLRQRHPELRHLSMGMSQDYEVAVEEGADFVRIGTALFQDGSNQ
jgi:hypothetical protein